MAPGAKDASDGLVKEPPGLVVIDPVSLALRCLREHHSLERLLGGEVGLDVK